MCIECINHIHALKGLSLNPVAAFPQNLSQLDYILHDESFLVNKILNVRILVDGAGDTLADASCF
jgi:hypothetical protein